MVCIHDDDIHMEYINIITLREWRKGKRKNRRKWKDGKKDSDCERQ